MRVLMDVLVLLLKGGLLLIGGLLLLGGGACTVIGVANVGQGGWGFITLIAAIVTLVGFLLIKGALLISRNEEDDS